MTVTVPSRVGILGVPLDIVLWNTVLDWAAGVVAGGAQHCYHLVTLNPEYVMLARRDLAFLHDVRQADLVVADGFGVVRAARSLHGRETDRVTGTDLTAALVERSGEWNAPVFLLGAAPRVADRAAGRFQDRFPAALIAGTASNWSSDPRDDEISIDAIERSGAKILLVAYGAPGQVRWIERNRERLGRVGVRLAVGVGGALDFHAGDVPRAPDAVQRIGLEWLYRLIREPWRWRRQLVLPQFAYLVYRERVRRQ